jgi:hypothetical protein
MLLEGQFVRTAERLEDRDFTICSLAERLPNALGAVVGSIDSHGLCYRVIHEDGTVGYYDPDELRTVPNSREVAMSMVQAMAFVSSAEIRIKMSSMIKEGLGPVG